MQTQPLKPAFLTRVLVLLKPAVALLAATAITGLAACGSTKHNVELLTVPQGAKIFVNGKLVGESNRTVTLDFAVAPRNYVQVMREGFDPVLNTFTEDTLPGDGRIVIEMRRN